ncbi:hypothetical protein GQ600_11848 [Phytophthora cactorum]|nr:hypothetical protein GQ600_11848 [Phytophthora cactorum]
MDRTGAYRYDRSLESEPAGPYDASSRTRLTLGSRTALEEIVARRCIKSRVFQHEALTILDLCLLGSI